MKAYALHFTTGEYSDRDERVVCVYFDRDLAKRHLQLANGWLKAKGLHDAHASEHRQVHSGLKSPFDPELTSTDFDGGSYLLVEVPAADGKSLGMMEHAHENPGDLPIFADWCEEEGWTPDAGKFRK